MIDYPFTPVPNWFFQVAPTLKEAELRIMLQVWFDTAGRQRDENILAYSYIADTTGITSTTSISKALKSLEDRELIERSPGRLSGQKIKIFPKHPAALVLRQAESTTTLSGVGTPLSGVDYYAKRSHNKNQPESKNLETTTESAADLESLFGGPDIPGLLLSYGIHQTTISKLIPEMIKHGIDKEDVENYWGYVCSLQPKNPAAYVVTLIARNAVIGHSKGHRPVESIHAVPVYHYFDNGGLEYERHNGQSGDCLICKQSQLAQ